MKPGNYWNIQIKCNRLPAPLTKFPTSGEFISQLVSKRFLTTTLFNSHINLTTLLKMFDFYKFHKIRYSAKNFPKTFRTVKWSDFYILRKKAP